MSVSCSCGFSLYQDATGVPDWPQDGTHGPQLGNWVGVRGDVGVTPWLQETWAKQASEGVPLGLCAEPHCLLLTVDWSINRYARATNPHPHLNWMNGSLSKALKICAGKESFTLRQTISWSMKAKLLFPPQDKTQHVQIL